MSNRANHTSAKNTHPKRVVRNVRARSMPHRRPFVRTILFSSIHYLGIVSSVTALVIFWIQPTSLAMKIFIVSVIITVFTWFVAFLQRRHTYCPLCKGTPLINSGALTHRNAVRLFPFNHGTTAILSIIATQKFRCMDCGTLFDLFKPQSHIRHKDDNTD